MPKTPIDAFTLSGRTMGTFWQVRLDTPLADEERHSLTAAFQAAVGGVDQQMSTWNRQSALMRFNAAPCDEWHPLPAPLMTVLEAGLAVSALSGQAFEMNVGAAVRAWGFGPDAINLAAIRQASAAAPVRAADALTLNPAAGLARKAAPLSLDLSGIAKGYGVDRLAETALGHGITRALCSIDGEVRALGRRADGSPWCVGIDAPDAGHRRGSHSILMLDDGAVATSGDYRHFIEVRGTRLSHTINPLTHAPLLEAPASVTVMAQSCMMADAMATALMVLGPDRGRVLAEAQGLSALFIRRDGTVTGTGHFSETETA